MVSVSLIIMEQCSNGTVAEDTNALSGVRDTVVASVAEKHESELQEKTVACGDSVPDLCTEDSTKLSAGSSKEDGELSSSR